MPSIPTILSIRFMLNPEWGVINQVIFKLTGLDGPNWLNDRWLALSMAMLTHIWKSLPFWTLILIAGRLAIPAELYEAASVDGATTWQKFKFVTWPSMRTLYVTSLDPVDDLDARRLQQRLPPDRRRPRRPDAHPRDARHPLPAARPGRPGDGDGRLRDAARAARSSTS